MLTIDRIDLARNLLAYGEPEASARVADMSEEQFQKVGEIGFRHALTGMHLLKAGCLAAVEVLEGAPRPLKRKKRVWSDAPAALPREINPTMAAIMKRFEAYAGGGRLRKKEIVDGLVERLAPGLDGFRFYRSQAQFRRPFADGFSAIGLEYGHGSLSIRFGVRHNPIEQIREKLLVPQWKPVPFFPASISKSSINMGPTSPFWPHPMMTRWPISGSEGLEKASHEIADFIREIVLPYVILHQDPMAIRETLLNAPGHADPLLESTVFVIDRLMGRRDWLYEDYQRLKEQRAQLAARIVALRQQRAPTASPDTMVPPMGIGNPQPDRLTRDYEMAGARWDA